MTILFRWHGTSITEAAQNQWQPNDGTGAPLPVENPVTSRTADLAQTLGAVALTAAAGNRIAGALSQSLGTVTLSSGSTVAIKADSSVSLSAVSLAATASLAIKADASSTLASVSVSGAATAAIRADLAQTLSPVLLSSTAANAIVANFAQTLGAVTLLAEATLGTGGPSPITGDLSVTLGALTLAAAGTVASNAAMNVPLAPVVLEAYVGGEGEEYEGTEYRGGGGQVYWEIPSRHELHQPRPPKTLNPIVADFSITLGAVTIESTATMGINPAARRRRIAAAALMLQ